MDRLIDEAMDAYLEWRVECIALADAHDRWAAVPGGGAALARAYAEALDREQDAADWYAGVCDELMTRRVAWRSRRRT